MKTAMATGALALMLALAAGSGDFGLKGCALVPEDTQRGAWEQEDPVGSWDRPEDGEREVTEDELAEEESEAQGGFHESQDSDEASVWDMEKVETVGNPARSYQFALNLVSAMKFPEGTGLVSPASLERPLAELAWGASGETQKEILKVLDIEGEDRLQELSAELSGLASSWQSDGSPLSVADALWANDRVAWDEGFFEDVIKGNFGADIFEGAFDASTVSEINAWVKERTGGMIPKIAEELNPQSVLYLVDAVGFDCPWLDPYDDSQVASATFTTDDGEAQPVEMMYEAEASGYVEGEGYTGFVKPYEGARFSFVALLPDEDKSLSDLLGSLTGQELSSLVAKSQGVTKVNTGLPKFSGSYSMTLDEVLQELGMRRAFRQDAADFSPMTEDGKGRPWVSSVLQKTFVEVNESGTRAAAATSVDVWAEGAAREEEQEVKTVILDRPFAYLIVDTQANVPIFMGTVGSVA